MIKNANAKTEIKINEKTANIELFPESEYLAVLEKFASKNYSRLMQEKIAGLYDNLNYIEALEVQWSSGGTLCRPGQDDNGSEDRDGSKCHRPVNLQQSSRDQEEDGKTTEDCENEDRRAAQHEQHRFDVRSYEK